MDDIYQMYLDVPAFTRYFLTACFFFSFCMTYGIIDPFALVLIFEKLIWKF